jgi:cell shape-determining protein MreC
MGYENRTKKELIEIIEGQLDDIKELEAENDELWKLLDDIKESESITFQCSTLQSHLHQK